MGAFLQQRERQRTVVLQLLAAHRADSGHRRGGSRARRREGVRVRRPGGRCLHRSARRAQAQAGTRSRTISRRLPVPVTWSGMLPAGARGTASSDVSQEKRRAPFAPGPLKPPNVSSRQRCRQPTQKPSKEDSLPRAARARVVLLVAVVDEGCRTTPSVVATTTCPLPRLPRRR